MVRVRVRFTRNHVASIIDARPFYEAKNGNLLHKTLGPDLEIVRVFS